MHKAGVTPAQTAVVGDRIYTDIKSGLSAGAYTVLVLSGETTREILDASSDKPHAVMNSAREILDILKN
jgi:ribonucleotide monophosphatase NagD (HAD superfamily)